MNSFLRNELWVWVCQAIRITHGTYISWESWINNFVDHLFRNCFADHLRFATWGYAWCEKRKKTGSDLRYAKHRASQRCTSAAALEVLFDIRRQTATSSSLPALRRTTASAPQRANHSFEALQGRPLSWRSFVQTQAQMDVKQWHTCITHGQEWTSVWQTHTHTRAQEGLASPSQNHCRHVNLNKHGEPFVSAPYFACKPRTTGTSIFFRSMIDLRATSCWVGAQQHILWPVPWLLRYTCASGRNNTASLGIYIWDSGDQFEQSKYPIKRRDQSPHINPTRPELRIKRRISFILNFFFYMENSESTQQLYKQKENFKGCSFILSVTCCRWETWITSNWEEFPSSRSNLIQKQTSKAFPTNLTIFKHCKKHPRKGNDVLPEHEGVYFMCFPSKHIDLTE